MMVIVNHKLSKEALALLKKNGVTEETFFAWLAAKYKSTYNATLWTFFIFFELFFTYACWDFCNKDPKKWPAAVLFWLILNLCILIPVGFGTRLKKRKTTNNPTIQAMNLSYILYYTDAKKLAGFSPRTWENIRHY